MAAAVAPMPVSDVGNDEKKEEAKEGAGPGKVVKHSLSRQLTHFITGKPVNIKEPVVLRKNVAEWLRTLGVERHVARVLAVSHAIVVFRSLRAATPMFGRRRGSLQPRADPAAAGTADVPLLLHPHPLHWGHCQYVARDGCARHTRRGVSCASKLSPVHANSPTRYTVPLGAAHRPQTSTRSTRR